MTSGGRGGIDAIGTHFLVSVYSLMRPTISLVTAGVEMDVLGIAYQDFTHEQRDHVYSIIHARRTSRRTS